MNVLWAQAISLNIQNSEIRSQCWTGSVHSLTVKYIFDVTARWNFCDSTSVVSIRHLQLHLPMRGYGAGILGECQSRVRWESQPRRLYITYRVINTVFQFM